MAFIQKQDTDGTKSVLLKGELGYDDYAAGGDAGRVYVGDGTVNIPLVKKDDLLTKANKTNPSFTGSITEEVAALPALALDPANGTVQYTTLTANTTLTDSLVNGQFMILEVTYATFTLTLPTSTPINTLPDGTNTTDFYLFFKRGTTLYVSNVGGIK